MTLLEIQQQHGTESFHRPNSWSLDYIRLDANGSIHRRGLGECGRRSANNQTHYRLPNRTTRRAEAQEKTMKPKRLYVRTVRTPEELAALKADRKRYQTDRLTLEQAVAESGQAPQPLGEIVLLNGLLAQLRAERESQGLTLADLAKRTGIGEPALSRLERGATDNPTLGTIYRIAEALGKSVNCYLTDTPPRNTPRPKPKSRASR